jgi:hypothetical protein
MKAFDVPTPEELITDKILKATEVNKRRDQEPV